MDCEAKKKKQTGVERSHIQKSPEASQAPFLFKTINCLSASGYCFPVGTWSHFSPQIFPTFKLKIEIYVKFHDF